MAIINKTGITNGGTIQSEHVTRTIDALSSVGTDTIVATGSFSGSLRGSVAITSNSTLTAATAASTGCTFTYDLASKLNLTEIGKGFGFAIPLTEPDGPTTGSMYFDSVTPALWIYDGTGWIGFAPTLP